MSYIERFNGFSFNFCGIESLTIRRPLWVIYIYQHMYINCIKLRDIHKREVSCLFE
jgi:hypothetical protein